MLKKRLIFILYFQDGIFHLSRNFNLQQVGDSKWLIDKFNFSSIGDYIDELIIIDVSRNRSDKKNNKSLQDSIKSIMKGIFVPLTIGGGVYEMDEAEKCFDAGADKILINTAAVIKSSFVKDCVSKFGSQAVVGSIDIKKENNEYRTYIKNGTEIFSNFVQHINLIIDLKVGELFVNSIDRDGTGIGCDIELASMLPEISIPTIYAGGAGKPEHLSEALSLPNISAVGTGNLFNFIGTGFQDSRKHLSETLSNIRKL